MTPAELVKIVPLLVAERFLRIPAPDALASTSGATGASGNLGAGVGASGLEHMSGIPHKIDAVFVSLY